MRRIFAVALAAGVLFAGQASATPINVAAYNPNFGNEGTPVTLTLGAGTYNISYDFTGAAGQYQGWDLAASNFGQSNQAPAVSGCDANGANCSFGWLDSFGYTINGTAGAPGSVVFNGPAGTQSGASGQAYATSALALAAYSAAIGNDDLVLAASSNVTFFIPDSSYNVDNYGGVSLNIAAVNAVPEPSSIVLLAFGLLSMGYIARRKVM